MPARIIVAALAGFVLSGAFEPIAIPYVIPVAVAAFVLTLRGLGARSGWIPGLVFGGCFYYTHIWWMRESIGTDAWIMLSLLETSFYAVLGSVGAVLHRLRAWPAWFAAAWATMEVVRSGWPFSGMPWGRLGFAVVDTTVAPALAYVGITGVTFLLVAIGGLLAAVVTTSDRLGAVAGLVAVCAVAVFPAVVPWSLATDGEATVAVVQGDVPGRGNDVLEDHQQLTQNHVDATVRLAADIDAGTVADPDFVVWPENSTAVDPFANSVAREQVRSAVAAIDRPVLVGAIVDAGPDNVLNQGVVWDPVSGPGERYSKANPVTYGEYIPFRDSLPNIVGSRAGRIPRDMYAGTRVTPLTIGGVRVADSICFDVAYDDALREQVDAGAQMLVVQTSNASFIFTDQVEQQFAITRARAIETGMSLAVASTNGISAIIGPDGEVRARLDKRTSGFLVETVELKRGQTPGLAVSHALGAVLAALTVVGFAWGWLKRPDRTRGRSHGPRSEPDTHEAPPEERAVQPVA